MQTITTTSGRKIPLREVRKGLDYLIDRSPEIAEAWEYQGWQDGDPKPGEVWKISRIFKQSLDRPVEEEDPQVNPGEENDLSRVSVYLEKNGDTYFLGFESLPHWGRIVDANYKI